jgi:hypothetical protein
MLGGQDMAAALRAAAEQAVLLRSVAAASDKMAPRAR